MKNIEYKTSGVCAKKIEFAITDDNKIKNLRFLGGCPGNLQAIAKLVEGMDARNVAELLKNNKCGLKSTSCADQLSMAILDSLNK